MQEKNRIWKLIDSKKQQIYDCIDRIWEFAETRFDVGKSADVLCELLEQEDLPLSGASLIWTMPLWLSTEMEAL